MDTALDMERRHVREGLARIAAQEALTLRLQMDDPGGLLPKARELLAAMHEFQAAANEHLARLLSESGVPGPVKGGTGSRGNGST